MAPPKLDELMKQWKKSHSEPLRALILALDEQKPLADLQGLETLRIAQVVERLEPYAKPSRADDPRLTKALEPIIDAVTWSSDGSKPAWRAIFAAVTASNDARFRELKPGFKVRPLMQEWLVSAWAKAIAKVPEKTGTRDDDAKWRTALEALPKKKVVAGSKDEAALLADVFARPADDGPRLVYADFLQERGDPRGEFIALQCGARDEKRERALIKEHGKNWLGAIAPALGADFEFRRGFLAKGSAKFKAQRDAEKYGVLPDWATFEELEWREPGAASANQRKWTRFIGPAFRHLKIARRPHFASMLDAAEPWAVEQLEVSPGEPDDLKRFAAIATRMFPRLTTLKLSYAPMPGWFSGVTSLGHVTRLVLGGNSDPGPMLGPVSDTNVKELWFDEVMRFTRDASGKFTVLDFHVDDDTDEPRLLGHALRLASGFATKLSFGGRMPSNALVEKTLRERVRAEGGADPFAPRPVGALPSLEPAPKMTWLDEQQVLLAVGGVAYVVDAAKNRVVREFPIDRLLAVRRLNGGQSFLGLQNTALLWIDAQTGATQFELATPWHSGNRLNVSFDGKRVSLTKGALVELQTRQLVPVPRGAKEATLRAFDDSFWVQRIDDQPSIRRPGTKTVVPLVGGKSFGELLEVPGALIARTDEALVRWDPTSGKQTHSLEMRHVPEPAVPVRLSEDGSLVAVAETEKRVLVLHTTDLSPSSRLDVDRPVRGLALSPSGKQVAAIVGNALRVFEVR